MKKAIVTGANGFIGSHLVKELAQNDYFVYAVVRNQNSSILTIDNIPNIQIIYCDLSEISSIEKKIKDRDICIFYHFAWEGVANHLQADYQTQLQNVKFACDAVKAAERIRCKRFVFAGSLWEYESLSCMNHYNENIKSEYIYGISKLTANCMIKIMTGNLKIDYLKLIISNVYGVGEKSSRFIISTLNKIVKGEKLSFTKGEQLYDFIYITDAAKAIRLTGEKGRNLNDYYIGNSCSQSLKNFIYKIASHLNIKNELFFGEIPYSGPYLSFNEFDTKKLEQELGFTPDVSFEDGIKKTYEWLIETGNNN